MTPPGDGRRRTGGRGPATTGAFGNARAAVLTPLPASFIHCSVATTTLPTVALAGHSAYLFLPVATLPLVDFPSVNVSAALPGDSRGG